MKQILNLKIYKNWRNDVLFALLIVGLLLLYADSKIFFTLVCSKLAALGCGLVFIALWKKWDREGKIEDLKSLCEEE